MLHNTNTDNVKRFQGVNRDLIDFRLPGMHEYAHQLLCRILFGHIRALGIGKTAGEKTETLWSDLGKYQYQQRAMSLDHRLDFIALLMSDIGKRYNDRMGMRQEL